MPTATFKFVRNTKLGGVGDKRQRTLAFYGTITFSAATDTYATGGILPLAGGALKDLGPYGDRVPLVLTLDSQAGSGWQYQWNQATGKLQIFSGNSSGSGTTASAELTNGTALNAGTPSIATDVIVFEVVFPMTL